MALDLSGFRDPELGRALVERIANAAPAALEACGGRVKLMEVCGTHTVALARNGIRSVLPEGVELISGPGCPVCVTANEDIDAVIALSRIPDVILTTFGDMIRVPGSTSSLMREKASGADVRVVYSPLDALRVARENPDRQVVFVGVGFETTTPLIASCVKRAKGEGLGNFSVYTAHKTVPPALDVLVNADEVEISAFILPGHVSTIIGVKPYEFLAERYNVPGTVMGFEPIDLLAGIERLLLQLASGNATIANEYKRCVADEGNTDAQQIIAEVFEPCDAKWRGIGAIAGSGLKLRGAYAAFDARAKFEPEVEPTIEPKGCRCGDVLRGCIAPGECPLFARACSPEHPIGPCMVSSEGSCAAHYKYLR